MSHFSISDQATLDILALGCLAVDDLLLSPIWPEPDTKTRLIKRDRQGGGLTGNAMVAASRFGARVGYGGSLGVDSDSQFLRELYLGEGISLEHCRSDPSFIPIRSTIVIDKSKNTRTIWFDLPGKLGALETWPPEEAIRSSKVLFVDHYGIEGMIRAAKIARSAGVEVVADLERDEHPRFHELLPLVDHLILSRKFATKQTGKQTAREAVEVLAGIGAKVTIVTDGEEGAWIVAGGNCFPFPAFPVQVVDSTGCGDAFHGVYAACLAAGMPLVDRLKYASASAALKALHIGAQKGLPTRGEIDSFLAQKI